MSWPDIQPTALKPRRRWFQYSMRTMLAVVLLAGVFMSWLTIEVRRQQEAVQAIRGLGGSVVYLHQLIRDKSMPPANSRVSLTSPPPGPAWLRRILGEDFFATVVHVSVHDDAQMELLKELPHVKTVEACGPHGISDAGLAHLRGLAELETLIIFSGEVTDSGLQHLQRLNRLRSLTIVSSKVTDNGLEYLKGLTQLESLELIDTRATDDGVQNLRRALPNCSIWK